MDPITLPDRVGASVPEDVGAAIRRAASVRGVSVADYVRGALFGRLVMDGVPVQPLPDLVRVRSVPGRPEDLKG
jgi:hypothetical protein